MAVFQYQNQIQKILITFCLKKACTLLALVAFFEFNISILKNNICWLYIPFNLVIFSATLFFNNDCHGPVSFSGLYGAKLVSQKTDLYPPYCHTAAHIRVTRNFGINVTFSKFDMEPVKHGACSDYLRVFKARRCISYIIGCT